jgi:hypothetical protein
MEFGIAYSELKLDLSGFSVALSDASGEESRRVGDTKFVVLVKRVKLPSWVGDYTRESKVHGRKERRFPKTVCPGQAKDIPVERQVNQPPVAVQAEIAEHYPFQDGKRKGGSSSVFV